MQLMRTFNISIRTAHIAVTSVLFGGHVFDVPREQLAPWLHLTIATGVLLIVAESFPRVRWAYQGRGLLVWIKLALLAMIPWLWPHRAWLLLTVVILASVGSHMPARFRYFSLLHGRVLDEPKQVGGKRLAEQKG